MALERRLTAYKYINKSVPHPFQEAILWHDSGSNAVQFECAGDTTPWHGELRWVMLDQTIIRFDSMCTDDRPPILKVVCLFASAPETYSGCDYRGRLIKMHPMHQWIFDPSGPSPVWKRVAEWTVTSHEWILVVDSDEPGDDLEV